VESQDTTKVPTGLTLYSQAAHRASKEVIYSYSTSFGMATRLLSKDIRHHVENIYALVRVADEIVDGSAADAALSAPELNPEAELNAFEQETYRAMRLGFSTNLIIHAFAVTAREVGISKDIVEPFFCSMRQDLTETQHTQETFDTYVYGSAEVVGLMCLRVFTEGNDARYQALKEPARRLGAAFQKINFLRDIRRDYDERGRIYFPGIDFTHFTNTDKAAIEKDIARDFEDSLVGIRQLPDGARLGVLLAYRYYTKLFDKIRKAPADKVTQERFRVNDGRKIVLLFQLKDECISSL
jgi:phytoene/squalene synthetase